LHDGKVEPLYDKSRVRLFVTAWLIGVQSATYLFCKDRRNANR
jgi:hypothetical protein